MTTRANTIGERIRELRNGWMTQQELATAAGVDVSLIRKLEQGQRHTASVASLHRIARALDVDLGELFGREALPDAGPDAGVVALRRAVSDVDDLLGGLDADPLPLDEARRTVTYLWGTYWSGKFDSLAGLIPPALAGTRATLHEANLSDRPMAADALSRVYWVAGCTLAHMRQQDAAFMAVRRAVELANTADDELLSAALRGSVSWQLLVQGRFDEAERVATRTAQSIEPTGDAGADHLSVFGSLIISAATANARGNNASRARDLLNESREVAARVGVDRNDYETPFGPSQVVMQTVDVGVVTEDYAAALRDAGAMPSEPGLPLAARARHMTDRAFAHTRLGEDDKALNLLLATEGMAPDWMQHQTLVKYVTRELLAREARKSTRLRELAERIGVTRTA
ncbi:transcriptional regulator [Actinophytocola xinjiangensis]|uniref:Transcriptional regulator n=1 Tax=Actinophytocola xinjiangensis TaxID=485602 RepID=A0A7Z0WEQ9_9PSEU|nr:helix-turn-helix transcriptional regulator [Actinophytocola xinjiangensis]OLF04708.1 transcriptional regulator [Actinophytocola xinjiangensis]